MAEAVRVPGISGEDAAFPGSAGDDVVQGAAPGEVLRRCLDHLSIHHSMMEAVVVTVSWVVAFPELPENVDNNFALRFPVIGAVDDDYVEVGLLVPAASGRGTEEDDGRRVGLDCQVPAEGDCGRVGTRVDYGRQLVADAVSSHRRHGMVSGRPARRRQWTWRWSTT